MNLNLERETNVQYEGDGAKKVVNNKPEVVSKSAKVLI